MRAEYVLLILGIIVVLGTLVSQTAVSQEVNVSASVLPTPYFSAVFNYNTVYFPAAYQGTSNVEPSPHYNTGAYSVSIDTSVYYYVVARESGGFINNGLTLKMAVSRDQYQNGAFYQLTTSDTEIYYGSPGIWTDYHQYLLDISPTAIPGNYMTTVYITLIPQY